MPTLTFTYEEFERLDKTGWTPKLIKQWNRRCGFMEKLPSLAVGVPTAYLHPSEARRVQKQRKRDERKPIIYASRLDWDEVPTRMPYRFVSRKPYKPKPHPILKILGETVAKVRGSTVFLAYERVEVEESFLLMAERSRKVEQVMMELATG